MKINVYKMPGGVLACASEYDIERINKFKTGEMYEIDIKYVRNPVFHRKVFAFFQYCFQYYVSHLEHLSEYAQFDKFRKDLTILAGYKEEYYSLDGSVRVEAKSLEFGKMDQDEFEECYQALIQAAIYHIFPQWDEYQLYNELGRFFK